MSGDKQKTFVKTNKQVIYSTLKKISVGGLYPVTDFGDEFAFDFVSNVKGLSAKTLREWVCLMKIKIKAKALL